MSPAPSFRKGKGWILARRLSQLFCLAIFLLLFLKTDYSGSDRLDTAVNLIFRIDPFVAASVMLAVKGVVVLLAPALFLVVLSLMMGRLFCGWGCPLGSTLDIFRKIVVPKTPHPWKTNRTIVPGLSHGLLVTALVAACFSFPLAGYLDPFSILVRGMTQALYPALDAVSTGVFTFTYQFFPDWANSFTEPIYQVLRGYVLPAEHKIFQQVYLGFVLLAGVLLAEYVQPRFFCRNLCPLGAMLGSFSRYSLLIPTGGDDSCGKCRLCGQLCRMGAVDARRTISKTCCTFCNECVAACPRGIIGFSYGVAKKHGRRSMQPAPDLSRRTFVTAMTAGLTLPALQAVSGASARELPPVIRPPGSQTEKEFLARCVRCGECLQVCITNGLQSAFLETGITGIFSPHLVSRIGYCEYNCSLCGQVCPTGAIEELPLAEKQKLRIGLALFDRNRCLPHAKGIPCMVCEEHCPVPDKAIKFLAAQFPRPDGTSAEVKQPYVVDDLCIGCGICENRCPLEGEAAIVVLPSRNSPPLTPYNIYG